MPRQHPLEKYRNIGIIAHISAGKTTTSTCILYHTGKVHKIGTLEKGTTPLDWMELSWFLTGEREFSPNPKLFGGKPTILTFREFVLSIKWIKWALISN